MSVAVVRSPVVYGPRDKGLLPFFKLVRLRIAPIYGDGGNRFSWVYADDFATAIAASINAKSSGSVYTIADGPSHSWRELADAFGNALGRRPYVIQVPPSLYSFAGTAASLGARVARRPLLLNRDKIIEMRQPYWTCNNDLITKELGWKPVVGIEEGLQLTVRWYQEHRWL